MPHFRVYRLDGDHIVEAFDVVGDDEGPSIQYARRLVEEGWGAEVWRAAVRLYCERNIVVPPNSVLLAPPRYAGFSSEAD